jgi:AraC-like DNA-binding protein
MSASAESISGLSLERGQMSPHEAAYLHISRIGMKESAPSRLDTVNQFLDLVEDTLGLAPGDPSPSVVHALRVLKGEVSRACATRTFAAQPDAAFAPSRFAAVLEHIEDHLESGVGLGDLASMMGLSVSRFSHTFKATFGVAPYRYIVHRRIAKAKTLLRTTDSTVAAIAARVGFSSQSRFSQMFAHKTGLTPSAYRDLGTLRALRNGYADDSDVHDRADPQRSEM